VFSKGWSYERDTIPKPVGLGSRGRLSGSFVRHLIGLCSVSVRVSFGSCSANIRHLFGVFRWSFVSRSADIELRFGLEGPTS
jgi:hypothetical protein